MEPTEREFLPSRPFRQMTREERLAFLTTEIDKRRREIGRLTAESVGMEHEKNSILSAEYRPVTAFDLKPLIDESREIPPIRRPMGAPAE
jgi:hypothetical protein